MKVRFSHRHLLNDLVTMLPHSRKDAKQNTKSKLYDLNGIVDLRDCNNILFFEARKRQDLHVWLSKAPNGPCVKMHLQNCLLLPIYHPWPPLLGISKLIVGWKKCIQWKNSTSPGTLSKAPARSSGSTRPSSHMVKAIFQGNPDCKRMWVGEDAGGVQ